MTRIEQLPFSRLADYARIPIAFEIRSFLKPTPIDSGLGGITLSEQPADSPHAKNFDAFDPPAMWAKRFDMRHWAMFGAFDSANSLVGGAVLAARTPNLHLLDDRNDLALLWDLRVAPDCRRQGIGRALFTHVADWARARKYSMLKVESQNTNVPACRFYASCGCVLGGLQVEAYPEAPGETMLLWYYTL